MSDHDFMPIDGWDHIEIWVGNAKQSAYFYENAYGFSRTAYAGPETGVRDRASYVLEQGDIRFVVTSGLRSDSDICRWAASSRTGRKTTRGGSSLRRSRRTATTSTRSSAAPSTPARTSPDTSRCRRT